MSKNTFEVNAADWEASVLNSTTPVLVDFSAEWCPPCRMLDPIVDEIASEYDGRMRVARIDADENPDVVMQYGVLGMPTLILFKDGEPVERIVGFKPKSKIVSQLTAHI
jgi:thioredoxin 1